MQLLKKLTFDSACVRTSAVIFLLAWILVLSALVNVTARGISPLLSGAVIFAADLSACAMLTLYFSMTARSLSNALLTEEGGTRAAPSKRNRIYYVTDLLACVLKMVFILSPFFASESGTYLPHTAALITDAVVSRLYFLRVLEGRGEAVPATDSGE